MELEKDILTFDGPAKYRIRVRGMPLFDWTDRLGGLTLKSATADGPDRVTVFEGWMPDQAALSGVLNTFYDLHLSLISVEALGDKRGSVKENAPDGTDSRD